MSIRTYFRGVIWPRQDAVSPPVAGPDGPVYRYAVVGLLLTDAPIERFEGQRLVGGVPISEVALDGAAPDLPRALAAIREAPEGCGNAGIPGRPPYPFGDATSVLVGLEDWGAPHEEALIGRCLTPAEAKAHSILREWVDQERPALADVEELALVHIEDGDELGVIAKRILARLRACAADAARNREDGA